MTTLRVAYAGHDFFAPCLRFLLTQSNVDVVLFLTHPAAHNNKYVRELARQYDIPTIKGKLNSDSIDTFNAANIDLLISAAYFYKIPVEMLKMRYAVNVHPSLLPSGRGPNPLPYFIDGYSDACGVTIHEMTSAMDRGPILVQERIANYGTTVDELYLEIVATAPKLLNKLIGNIDGLFSQRREQRAGTYWSEYTEDDRTVRTYDAKVHDVVSRHRKFGMFGTILQLKDGSTIETTQVTAKECCHEFEPGAIVGSLNSGGYIIALHDGLLAIGPAQKH